MAKKKYTWPDKPPRYRVGDWVSYESSPTRARVLIIEDHGPLGRDGEHIYRIRRVLDWGEVKETSLSESHLEPADPPPADAPPPDPAEWGPWPPTPF